MNNKEYEVLITDIDPKKKFPIIFNDNNIIIKFDDKDITYSYTDISNVKMPSLAIIKNVSFKLKNPNLFVYTCFIEFTKANLKERNELFSFLSSAELREKEKEHIYKCNTCGNIFTYTKEDIENNDKIANSASLSQGLSTIGGLFGTRYDMYEQQKRADSLNSQVIDFSKCPKCNSKNIVEVDPNEINNTNEVNNNKKTDNIEELKRFKELLDMGAITQEEYDQKKKELLNL